MAIREEEKRATILNIIKILLHVEHVLELTYDYYGEIL